MTPKAEVQRRLRERRRAGLIAVTIGDDRQPDGVRRGEVSAALARAWLKQMDAEKEKRDVGSSE